MVLLPSEISDQLICEDLLQKQFRKNQLLLYSILFLLFTLSKIWLYLLFMILFVTILSHSARHTVHEYVSYNLF